MKYNFEFISTYQNSSDYRVYELGTKNSFRIYVNNETKTVGRSSDNPMTEELLNEFNSWRLRNHEEAVKYCALRGYEIDNFVPLVAR